MEVLRAADEAHGGQAVAPAVQARRRLADGRVVGQAEVVVRAEIQDRPAALDRHVRLLRRAKDALVLEQPAGPDLAELLAQENPANVRTTWHPPSFLPQSATGVASYKVAA